MPSLVDNANHLVDPVFGSQTTVLSNCYLQAEQKSAFGMKKKSQILIVPEFLVILLIWWYLIYFQYLNLLNGERLYLSEYVKLIFETDELTDASPATVSRCVSAVLSLQSTVEPPLTAMHLSAMSTPFLSRWMVQTWTFTLQYLTSLQRSPLHNGNGH